MPSPLRNPLAWLLCAALFLAAAVPPSGLDLCIGEDGHVHVGMVGVHGGDEACVCVDDGCACLEDQHGHEDIGIAVQMMQREGEGFLAIALPAPEPAPVVLVAACEALDAPDAPATRCDVFERPPQWPPARRSPVLLA